MWDKRSEKTEVSRSKGDVGTFWGGHCGRMVPSEEPKGIAGEPSRAQGTAQGRTRELYHTLGNLLSVQKALWGGKGGRINKYKQNLLEI